MPKLDLDVFALKCSVLNILEVKRLVKRLVLFHEQNDGLLFIFTADKQT